MKRQRSIAFASLVLAAGSVIGTQSAFASTDTASRVTTAASSDVGITGWPTGCIYGLFWNGADAECRNGNGGHYRAIVRCDPWDHGPVFYRAAPKWVGSGRSAVFCPPQSDAISAGIETRAN